MTEDRKTQLRKLCEVPQELEWSAEDADAGTQEYHSEYVDGWNDALGDVRLRAEAVSELLAELERVQRSHRALLLSLTRVALLALDGALYQDHDGGDPQPDSSAAPAQGRPA